MADINALRQKVADLAAAGRVVLKRNDGNPTQADIIEHRNIVGEARTLGEQIDALQAQRNLETVQAQAAATTVVPGSEPTPDEKRSETAEAWAMAAARAIVASSTGHGKDKLTAEERDMEVAIPAQGGIFVPDQFVPQLFGYKMEDEIVLPGATILPGNPEHPDAVVDYPTLDQSGGAFAGIQVDWIDEGDPKPDTDMFFDTVTLHPHECAAHVVLTDKLLRNAPVVAKYVEEWLPKALRGERDRQFLTGNGVGLPLGIGDPFNPGILGQVRAAPAAVAWADIIGMLQLLAPQCWGNAIWIANQSLLSQLAVLCDDNDNAIWHGGDISKGIPATLYGIPVRFTGRTPILGDDADLMLIDRSFYGVRLGGGIVLDYSKHVHFTSNRTVLKMFQMIDGQPLVTSPLLLEDAVNFVSPFVALVT